MAHLRYGYRILTNDGKSGSTSSRERYYMLSHTERTIVGSLLSYAIKTKLWNWILQFDDHSGTFPQDPDDLADYLRSTVLPKFEAELASGPGDVIYYELPDGTIVCEHFYEVVEGGNALDVKSINPDDPTNSAADIHASVSIYFTQAMSGP